jgi:thiol-disulfide isomerase/thioredoxin
VDRGIQVGMQAAVATLTTRDGDQAALTENRGQNVMLWLFATWCLSCLQSVQELQRNDQKLQSLTVLAGKMHKNAGYSGPSVREFVEEYAPDTVDSDRWVWGRAGQETTQTFSPRGVIDVYYLVDEDGIIRTVDTVPGTTTHKIASFANE